MNHYSDELLDKLYNAIPCARFQEDEESEREIYFTPLSLDGLDDMHEYSRIPVFFKYLEFPCNKTKDDTKKYLLKMMNRIKRGYHGGNTMYWFFRLKSSDKVIGTAGLVGVDSRKKSAEIGFGISPLYGRYIFEMLWILLDYSFGTLELERIWSVTHHNNQPVLKLLKTTGFKEEGRLRNFYLKYDDDCYFDAIISSLLKDEVELTRCRAFAKIVHGR